jgi:hypothetical protein
MNRRSATKALGLAALATAPAAAIPASKAAPVDPVVTLWEKTQAVNAELERVSGQHQALHDAIALQRPGQPMGSTWVDWHRGHPDLARCVALHDRSNELCSISSDLYDQIAVAVAVRPAGVRAKAAAALSVLVQEKSLREEFWFADLVINALREAAAGSAV